MDCHQAVTEGSVQGRRTATATPISERENLDFGTCRDVNRSFWERGRLPALETSGRTQRVEHIEHEACCHNGFAVIPY